ncbi:hypothetical protein DLAC_11457 [Tieghemostelium lacteum]|uniref:Uncharacterized protein n=1 Tax=Tieghemostelium lacteum TaxID=361077 RepID=A0A152A7Q1_TIELA|nr:hypothetical protein DLAC_11457 [Tieghemostelium lacteum]|eukprot:KYR02151.1 hypothetical protein DLAC_11457 [Tieghemostelium lacteum]
MKPIEINLSNFICIQIINKIVEFKILPLQYRLSLGLISKWIFKALSNSSILGTMIIHNVGYINDEEMMEISTHIKSPWCMIKRVRELNTMYTFDILEQQHHIDFISNMSLDVEELSLLGPLQYVLPITTVNYPSLKRLKLKVWLELVKFPIDQFPLITHLTIHINSNYYVQYLISLLDHLKDTLEHLNIVGLLDTSPSTETLYNYLSQYKVNQLRTLRINVFEKSYFQAIVKQTQMRSLVSLTCTNNDVDSVLEILEVNHVMQYLYVVVQSIEQFNKLVLLLNERPSLTSLKISGYKQKDYKSPLLMYIQDLEIFSCDVMINELLHCNSLPESHIRSLFVQPRDINQLISFQGFIEVNNINLTSLRISINYSNEMVLDLENISWAISQHPTLVNLYLTFPRFQKNVPQKLIKHLHLSPSLQYIGLNLKVFKGASKFLSISTPFQLVSNEFSFYLFIRNGLNYDQGPTNSWISTIYKAFTSFYNKWSPI